MYLKSGVMELRGVADKVSKKTGKTYKVANMEEYKTGEPVEVYLGDNHQELASASKGERFVLLFSKNRYGSLDLVLAEKVND